MFLAKLGSCQKNSFYSNKIILRGQGGMIATPDFFLKDTTKFRRINCVWTMEAPKGQRIKLNFRRINLEYSYYDKFCYSNYVLIGNGVALADNASALAKMCYQNEKKISVVSSGRYLTVQYRFSCDGLYCYMNSNKGMYLVFEAVNSEGRFFLAFRDFYG